MRIKIFLFLLIGLVAPTFAQNIVNIPVPGNSNQVRAVNLKDSGIILLDKSSEGVLRIQKWDTDLNKQWETRTEIPEKTNYIDEYFDGRFLYIILEPKDARNFILLKISSAFAAFQRFDFPLSKGFQYGFFAANDEVICLGGAVKNEPFLAILETVPGSSPKFVSGGSKGTLELQALHVADKTIYATFIHQTKKSNELVFREMDYNGKVLSSNNIPAKEDNIFLSAKYFEHVDGPLLVGNYGLAKTNSNSIPSSQGIFVHKLSVNKTNYYNFSAFKNLFSFMSERQRERLDKQVEKKKNQGREYNFDYRLFISGLQFVGENTLVVGELFQPEYRSRNYGYYGFAPSMYWGRPYLYNYYGMFSNWYGYPYRNSQVFDGFKYLEGVIFALAPDGTLAWDQAYAYKNIKYYDLQSHLKVSQTEDKTIALYSESKRLKVNEISLRGQSLAQREFDPESLDLQFANKKSEFSNFEHWYDDVYFNWGVMKKDGQHVCFIQKIIP